jgi:hypothetical protein
MENKGQKNAIQRFNLKIVSEPIHVYGLFIPPDPRVQLAKTKEETINILKT